jgi:hypothetical protein
LLSTKDPLDPDALDTNSCTLLHYAVTRKNKKLYDLFIALGSNPNLRYLKGTHYCCDIFIIGFLFDERHLP